MLKLSKAQTKKTDNSYLQDKVELRLSMLPDRDINVLDAFTGNGIIWRNIKDVFKNKINLLRIDIERKDKGFILKGDNLKFLKTMDLNIFDVIDLDGYGLPYNQLNVLFEKEYKGIVFITVTRVYMSRVPTKFLNDLGYTKEMVKKCPILFWKNRIGKTMDWLALKGIKKINARQVLSGNEKMYAGFVME